MLQGKALHFLCWKKVLAEKSDPYLSFSFFFAMPFVLQRKTGKDPSPTCNKLR